MEWYFQKYNKLNHKINELFNLVTDIHQTDQFQEEKLIEEIDKNTKLQEENRDIINQNNKLVSKEVDFTNELRNKDKNKKTFDRIIRIYYTKIYQF